ncbi:50S ribosomal protein L25/general stress protein Ctc [Asticcacaulis sp. EMRT-3]|uniref:50S ribosomal protein L25/general stress protein Ctc n=1 Tax=Asticcacaulis sp. EMRT-3 TaxID=3040349 RepID=UPI0024AFCC36|nr:50S ribosomal protein L25/general stress protein Ctc [Asticcacaulis sp. EMRT-3]MDI7774878.1 50S ribosomal protein L25/general stress protein Ctc [Asticcacaulis sp. EMRT-3]
MADIVLDVEVRDRTGTGGAREARKQGKLPGILYGGDLAPVAISVSLNEFRKALYTGKLAGHLVTLKHGKDTQKVIAKAIDFHPVTDVPVHFDLYRVDEHATIKISVPIHFKNSEASPGLKKGGALNISLHELEIMVPADHIPEDIIVDLTGYEIGQSIHISDLKLPRDVKSVHAADVVVASVTASGASASDEAAEAGEGA